MSRWRYFAPCPAGSPRFFPPPWSTPMTLTPASANSIASGSPTSPRPMTAAVKSFRFRRERRSSRELFPFTGTPPAKSFVRGHKNAHACGSTRAYVGVRYYYIGSPSGGLQFLELRDQYGNRLDTA